ncbi:hypothetical protein LR48_Vigan05g092600 [Vigna angularis]|uniref:Uncharacterized protein n=1 Tax=Phaseolus angularis TaxID=3914 RepID=A0A0L9UL71_PHAAN|nr:hypothetical protein LR48_Vigan05g092600 [Vigna angularis]
MHYRPLGHVKSKKLHIGDSRYPTARLGERGENEYYNQDLKTREPVRPFPTRPALSKEGTNEGHLKRMSTSTIQPYALSFINPTTQSPPFSRVSSVVRSRPFGFAASFPQPFDYPAQLVRIRHRSFSQLASTTEHPASVLGQSAPKSRSFGLSSGYSTSCPLMYIGLRYFTKCGINCSASTLRASDVRSQQGLLRPKPFGLGVDTLRPQPFGQDDSASRPRFFNHSVSRGPTHSAYKGLTRPASSAPDGLKRLSYLAKYGIQRSTLHRRAFGPSTSTSRPVSLNLSTDRPYDGLRLRRYSANNSASKGFNLSANSSLRDSASRGICRSTILIRYVLKLGHQVPPRPKIGLHKPALLYHPRHPPLGCLQVGLKLLAKIWIYYLAIRPSRPNAFGLQGPHPSGLLGFRRSKMFGLGSPSAARPNEIYRLALDRLGTQHSALRHQVLGQSASTSRPSRPLLFGLHRFPVLGYL